MKQSDLNMSNGCAFVDGAFVPFGDARLPIADWGFSKSDVAYDVVAVWDGAFFRLNDHMDRFDASMAHMHLINPYDRTATREILNTCVAKAELQRAYVSMMTTRGINAKGSRDPRDCVNAFYAYAVPYIWIVPDEQQTKGVDVLITDIERIPPESVDPRAKNFHWGDMVQALFQAYDVGAETALLLDKNGDIAEGPGFNVFALINDEWRTPARGVLEGITRKTAIELIQDAGATVVEGRVSAQCVLAADEVFLTSTAGGIMPVRRVSGVPIGTGHMGPKTSEIRAKYWELHSDPTFITPVVYPAT